MLLTELLAQNRRRLESVICGTVRRREGTSRRIECEDERPRGVKSLRVR